MKIAVIGAGNVGSTLAQALIKVPANEIFVGLRQPEDPKYAQLGKNLGGRGKLLKVADAVKASQFVILATPWPKTEEAIKAMGDLTGKVILDCTNPLKSDLSGLDTQGANSGAEKIASWAGPQAKVFKAFNHTGSMNMAKPDYGNDQKLSMLVCGDDNAMKPQVFKIVRDAGFEPFDAGPLSAAAMLENLAMLWIHLALKQMWGANFGFKVLKRSG